MPRITGSPRALPLWSALAATLLGAAAVTLGSGQDPAAHAAPRTAAHAPAHTGAHAGAHTAAGHAAAAAAPLPSGDDPDGDGYIPANPPVTGVVPSDRTPAPRYFHEFQANCPVTRTAPDDPIVYPGRPGASHDHTFMANTTTDAHSTTASLAAGTSRCKAPDDLSAYWMPTLYNDGRQVLPVGDQVIYYKSGVTDYTSVRPFPKGLRYVVGSPTTTADQFRQARGWVAGWECGDSFHNVDFPAACPAGTQLNIRYQAPSCWDGRYLDTPDHQAHMAYPRVKPGTNDDVCPASHPVAVPMVEFKMAFPVSGDMSEVALSSGRGYSFHYDFFNAWDDATLKALVDHCIVGGLQCDARGYDQTHPGAGAALGPDYRLPRS